MFNYIINKFIIFRQLENFFQTFIDIIAPPHCEICSDDIDFKKNKYKYICDKCLDSLPIAESTEKITNRLVSNFKNDELAISKAISLLSVKENTPAIQVVHALKYHGIRNIGLELGQLLGNLLVLEHFDSYDALIPIPIHNAKKRERGYNQSEYIANGVSKIINIPVRTDIIKRNKYTQTQTLLGADERKKNVEGAFSPIVDKKKVFNKTFLLIDDVLTTGATLNSCANTLLEMGVKRVDAATVALAD